MRVRYAVAAGFVVVVVALIFIRDEGYLGGRTEGGPLTFTYGGAQAQGAKAGRSYGFTLSPRLDGEPVEIQAVRPDFASPGLDVRAARTVGVQAGCGGCAYPRRKGELFVGSEYAGGGQARIGLRAKRNGTYYALGLIADYRRGFRRFRYYGPFDLCLAVGREAECGVASLPDADLAEIGGPGGAGRITLSNLSRKAIEVSDLAVEGGTAEPDAFGLRPGAGRTVRLEGCDRVQELRARVDGEAVDVPMTAAVDCG